MRVGRVCEGGLCDGWGGVVRFIGVWVVVGICGHGAVALSFCRVCVLRVSVVGVLCGCECCWVVSLCVGGDVCLGVFREALCCGSGGSYSSD